MVSAIRQRASSGSRVPSVLDSKALAFIQPFLGPGQSIDFSGSSEYLLNDSAGVDLELKNTFTIMLWLKHTSANFSRTLLETAQSPFASAHEFFLINTSSNTYRLDIRNNGGSVTKRYTHTAPSSAWVQWVFVVERGATDELIWYENGSDAAPTKSIDGVFDDRSAVSIEVLGLAANAAGGANWAGRAYSLALWNTVLAPAEISAIYNSGDGRNFDLANDSGNYASSTNLQHWWNLVDNVSGDVVDAGNGTAVDITTDGQNIDAADFVTDFPGI